MPPHGGRTCARCAATPRAATSSPVAMRPCRAVQQFRLVRAVVRPSWIHVPDDLSLRAFCFCFCSSKQQATSNKQDIDTHLSNRAHGIQQHHSFIHVAVAVDLSQYVVLCCMPDFHSKVFFFELFTPRFCHLLSTVMVPFLRTYGFTLR